MKTRGLSLFRRYHLSVFIILLLFFGLVLMSLRVKQQQGMAFWDAFLLELTAPVQKATTFVVDTIQGVFGRYIFLVHLHDENQELKQRIARLQEENHRMREMASANERLRKLLQFREKMSISMIAAEVIGQDPSSWFKSITINRGESHGVQKGMAVISPEGIVGQVLKAAPHYATVLLITDYNSSIDAIVQRSRAKAIAQGTEENRCQMKYLLRTEDVAVGDIVITSGLGGIFPKGLMVGQIMKVEKKGHGVFQYAELVPSVDLTKLEEVLIITETPVSLSKDEPGKKVTKIPVRSPKKR